MQLYSQVPAIAIRETVPHFMNNVSHSDYILRKYELRDVYNIDGVEIPISGMTQQFLDDTTFL